MAASLPAGRTARAVSLAGGAAPCYCQLTSGLAVGRAR